MELYEIVCISVILALLVVLLFSYLRLRRNLKAQSQLLTAEFEKKNESIFQIIYITVILIFLVSVAMMLISFFKI